MIAEKCAYDAELDAVYFEEQIQPKLAALSLPTIAKATGASASAASKWRAGRATPHPRRWAALAKLVGTELPESVR